MIEFMVGFLVSFLAGLAITLRGHVHWATGAAKERGTET